MRKNCVILSLIVLIFFVCCCSSVSASPASRIVSGVITNVASTVFKWLWSLKTTSKTGVSTRSMMKFESGYIVETVFDGSKLGIEPYAVDVSSDGEVLILDSENSNIYKISTPLSTYSRAKLIAGSAEGYSGHVDGKLREARMNHPKGLALDHSGNVYVADTMNMAIRKISDTGVVTIAGGRVGRGGGHVDGPSEDAKFSNDFDVIYVGSSCSLLVIDKGNQAIREIKLHEADCSDQQYDDHLSLGIAVLVAAGLFGYLMALLQRRIAAMLSYDSDPKPYTNRIPPAPYQRQPQKSVLPPLIPPEDEYEKQDDGLYSSLGKLLTNTGSSIVEIFSVFSSGSRKKPILIHPHMHQNHHPSTHGNTWPAQESFVIPHEDEPPPFETRDPTPRKNYPFIAKDVEKTRQFKQNQTSYYGSGWNNGLDYQQQQQPPYHMQQLQQHQYYQMHNPLSPETHYERENCEKDEIVFGAVQEEGEHRKATVIKAFDYGDPNYNVRSRYNHMSYSYGY